MFFNQIYNTGYEIIFVAFSVIIVAQIIKFFAHMFIKRQVDIRMLTTTGGMPSSHSAGVIGLTTAVGLISGFDSLIFAVSIGFSLVVMYDAAGLRRAAGKQAACLNRILEDFYKQELQAIGGKLKELLGHTPIQVFWGAILGIVYAYYMHQYFLGKF